MGVECLVTSGLAAPFGAFGGAIHLVWRRQLHLRFTIIDFRFQQSFDLRFQCKLVTPSQSLPVYPSQNIYPSTRLKTSIRLSVSKQLPVYPSQNIYPSIRLKTSNRLEYESNVKTTAGR